MSKIDLGLFKGKKYWRFNQFVNHTKDMTFEEGHEFCNELVKTIVESKPKLAKYDVDFFAKIGYDAEGGKKVAKVDVGQFDWNRHTHTPFNPNMGKNTWDKIVECFFSVREHVVKDHNYNRNIPFEIMLKRKYLPQNKFEVKSKPDAMLLVYKLKEFFRTKYAGDKGISSEELAERINNTINTTYTESYLIRKLKSMTDVDYQELKLRQKK